MASLDHVVDRLRSQMKRGEVVLFTGAGFSSAAEDRAGQPIPSSETLKAELWNVAFPGEPLESGTRLGDAFYAAKQRAAGRLHSLLQTRLAVNPETLSDRFRVWFSLPWHRCYTLNVDDLPLAVARRFPLPRGLKVISATTLSENGDLSASSLEVIHLNGGVWDPVDSLTFSEIDYASRLANPDSWYIRCSTDLLSRAVLYVGTELSESTLWQHLEMRKSKGDRHSPELRPGSCLVTPVLNRARQQILRELHIDWVPMTEEQFSIEILAGIVEVSTTGFAALAARGQRDVRRSMPSLVGELASEAERQDSEYLLGAEPTWEDVRTGRCIERECDGSFYQEATRILRGEVESSALLLSGTAGSGKSTSMMRLALRLHAEGYKCFWMDSTSNVEPHRVAAALRADSEPVALLIDDADLWGRTLASWLRELPAIRPGVLLVASMRSARVENVLESSTPGAGKPRELSMPQLTDSDIESLVRLLDSHNRLGVLKVKTHAERVEAFKRERGAGRQLLVAMIQATSGRKFKEKAFDEYMEISGVQKKLYGVTCIVHSQRYDIDRDEVLLASGASDAEDLRALEDLVRRGLIVRQDVHLGYRTRHRVVAEEIVSAAEFRPHAREILEGVAFAFASKVSPSLPQGARKWRRVVRFINHDFLKRFLDIGDGRAVYERIEALLHWNHHFWLQRGSLEVELGDLDLATHFLDTARAMKPEDVIVRNELGYLCLKKAAHRPTALDSPELFADGLEILRNLISEDPDRSAYPYHILGSQGLSYVRQAAISANARREILKELVDTVRRGVEHHPSNEELRGLLPSLEREWLLTAVG